MNFAFVLLSLFLINSPFLPKAENTRPTVIVVIGAEGTPEYGAQFARWAGLWQQAASKSGAEFTTIGLDEADGSVDDRTKLQMKLAEESGKTDAALWLVMIGHGTYDGRTAKFNLRGPDVSADDLTAFLAPLSRPIVIIDNTSSSSPFLSTLSGQGRIIITATRSGFEQNYARLGQYMAAVIADPQADLDKDGQTSLLEAFLTASHNVDEFYKANGRLATEHALLDDNGDALGTPADWFAGIRPVRKAEGGTTLDGYRAHQLHLLYSESEGKMPSELRARRDQLERQVLALRDSKDQFPEDEYFSKLEKLLCEIAMIYEQTENK
ncbi:MAG: hypothetical protein A2167_02815 [Planctomycetes bacterium RBG_13_46_10]|nr:MAG: hypothetical protein A2167_02815 [Planctomycetes bacterium RBG_13_46_10]